MFRPEPMVRIDLLLLQKDLDEAVRALARVRILHLRPAADLPGGGEAGAAAAWEQELERYRPFALRLQTVMGQLRVPAGRGEILDLGEYPLWERWAVELARRVERIRRRRQELQRLGERLVLLESFFAPLAEIEAAAAEPASWRWTHLAVGHLPAAGFQRLQDEFRHGVAFSLRQAGREVLTAVMTIRRHRPALEALLEALHFHPLELPRALAGNLAEAAVRIRRLRGRTGELERTLDSRLAGVRAENLGRLRDRLATVTAEIALLEARQAFAFAEKVALLSGWVPRRRLAELKGGLAASCGERYSLRRLPAQGDETPVALENPGLIRPFQKILAVYGTPSYEEVEPTPLLAAGFVLLFGMMFGDLGQGLVLAAAGWGLRRFTRFRQEGLIVTEVGISAALFGLLFGSCFGFEGLIPPLWFSPMHEIQLLMGVALGLGVVLILTALALRIRNARRESSLPALLTDRYGVAGLVFYAGAVLTLLLVWQRLVPPPALAWLALPLAGVFLHPLVKGGGGEGVGMRLAEGGIEVLETVLGFLANTFSFLRVAAFGLAHVGLFMAVFALAAVVRELPWGGLWVILVHLVGNLIILALEGLVVSIQAVRLQFYEFFSKFFRGGGVAYQPLALAAASEKRGG